ncbi:MAG: hypothetical protein ABI813_08375 [Bacteroidota bacterium]
MFLAVISNPSCCWPVCDGIVFVDALVMKKLTIFSVLCFLFCLGFNEDSLAQAGRIRGNSGSIAPFRVGSTTLSLGLGVGSEYKDDYYRSPLGMKAVVEWGLWHAGPGTISLGAEAGASFSNGGYYSDYRSHTAVIAIRAAWHYGWRVRGLDTYAGFAPGIGLHHYDYLDDRRYALNQAIPVFGAFIGASYFVTPHFGFNAEAGYDITDFQVGVIFKLK